MQLRMRECSECEQDRSKQQRLQHASHVCHLKLSLFYDHNQGAVSFNLIGQSQTLALSLGHIGSCVRLSQTVKLGQTDLDLQLPPFFAQQRT